MIREKDINDHIRYSIKNSLQDKDYTKKEKIKEREDSETYKIKALMYLVAVC